MYIRDTQTGGEYGAQNPYIEGALKIQYYLDGADITSNVEQDGDYPTTLYCFYYKTENDGTLNIKYYFRSANGILQEKPYSYYLVLPGTKLQSITPGSTSEWQYVLRDRETSGNFYYRDYYDNPNDTVTVNLVTDPDSPLKIIVSTSDETHGSVMISPANEDYNTNDEVEITAMSAPGYDFDYWKVTEITSIGAEIPKNNITKNPYKFNVIASEKYEAYFKIKEIQINCYNNLSSSDDWKICDNFTAKYGDNLPNRLIPYETGYKFIGYFSEKEGQGNKYYEPSYVEENSNIVERAVSTRVCDFATSPTSLYAYYELETYKITYVLNGGSGEMNPTSYNVKTPTFSLPIPARTNYEFEGWYEQADYSDTKITQISEGTVGDKTFYAKWINNSTIAKIATNEDIYNASKYIYGVNNNQCPTKEFIVSNGYDIVKFNNDYQDNQCVVLEDLSFERVFDNITLTNNCGADLDAFGIYFSYDEPVDSNKYDFLFYEFRNKEIENNKTITLSKQTKNLSNLGDYRGKNLYVGFYSNGWGANRKFTFNIGDVSYVIEQDKSGYVGQSTSGYKISVIDFLRHYYNKISIVIDKK